MDDNTMARKSTRQSIIVQSNSMIDAVDCLLIEILKRLPNAKAAIFCKLVCKHWNAIILSSDFITSFIHHDMISETRKPTFFVQIGSFGRSGSKFIMSLRDHRFSKYPKSKLRQLPVFLRENCKVHVVGSGNNLLLLRRSSNEVGIPYFLCNPFTMEWISLPPTPRPKLSHGIVIMEVFLCDPYIISSTIINDCYNYKVVCIFYSELGFVIQDFSSETNKWVETHCVRLRSFHFETSANTTYNGKIFSLSANSTEIGVYDHKFERLCYPIKCPGLELGYISSTCLGVSQCCLRLLQTAHQTQFTDAVLKVWELINNTNEWRLVHEVAPSKLKIFDNGHVYRFNNNGKPMELEALPIHPSDGDIVYFGYNNTAFSCNMKKKEIMVESYEYLCGGGVESFAITVPLWPTPIYPLIS